MLEVVVLDADVAVVPLLKIPLFAALIMSAA